jgi:hypothetical protein
MASGGKRDGAGRKPKADELKLIETINEAIPEAEFKEIWQSVAREAKKGSAPHQKLLFEYYYGKPKETVKHEVDEDKSFTLKIE